MDLSILISLIAVSVPFLAALTDRKRLNSDISIKMMDGAEKSIEIRDKDIAYLELKLANCRTESNHKSDYIVYLWNWIKKTDAETFPKRFDDYKIRKTPD